MTQYLLSGLILGLSAGLAPGPLLTLVLSETLTHGLGAGLRVAMAPLVTDLPIVLASLFLLSRLADFNPVLGLISLAGAGVILKMGMENFRAGEARTASGGVTPNSLTKGVMVNFLSPHPYIFWLSVGGSLTTRAWSQSPLCALGFILLFYVMLIGSKAVLALVASRSGAFLKGGVYRAVMKILGFLLCVLALVLVWDGLTLLGLV